MLSDVFPTGYHGAESGSAWPRGSAQLRSTSARVTPVGQIKRVIGRARRAGEARPAGMGLRDLLHPRSAHGHRPVPREALQPPAAGPDRRRQCQTGLDRLPRTEPGRSACRLRALRRSRRWLDQGAAPPLRLTEGHAPAAGRPRRSACSILVTGPSQWYRLAALPEPTVGWCPPAATRVPVDQKEGVVDTWLQTNVKPCWRPRASTERSDWYASCGPPRRPSSGPGGSSALSALRHLPDRRRSSRG